MVIIFEFALERNGREIALLRWVGGEPENGLPVWRLNQVLSIIQERIQNIPHEGRWAPMVWSTMHMYSTTQLGKMFALKRGLDPEFAGLVCAFHDIYTLHTGKYENHAENAAGCVQEVVEEYNRRWGEKLGTISEKEVEGIITAIRGHSNKAEITDDPYAELLKDVDTVDAYFHGLEPSETASGRRKRLSAFLKEFQLE